jgi:hypothetical protein
MSFNINVDKQETIGLNVSTGSWPSGKRVPTVEKLAESQSVRADDITAENNSHSSPIHAEVYKGVRLVHDGRFVTCEADQSKHTTLDLARGYVDKYSDKWRNRVLYNDNTDQWVVRGEGRLADMYFGSLDDAEDYSRNMMMAGITHYPEKVPVFSECDDKWESKQLKELKEILGRRIAAVTPGHVNPYTGTVNPKNTAPTDLERFEIDALRSSIKKKHVAFGRSIK